MKRPALYGLLAEFATPAQLLQAARAAAGKGYREMDGYSPMPVEGLSEAIGFRGARIPLIILIGGLCGCFGGYYLQYWACVLSYPINVGGRPLDSWPAFIPVIFELTILCASIAAVLGMLACNGLPMPYHPVFNVPRFALASSSKFFLCVESRDPLFIEDEARLFLWSLKPEGVYDVAP